MLQRPNPGTQFASSPTMMACRALVLVAFTGCILPPPIEEGTLVKNQSPKILTLSPPPDEAPKTMSVLCLQYTFQATVQDPDPSDTIYWRYFIDYRDDLNPLGNSETFDIPPDPSNPGGARTITFFPDPRDQRFGDDPEKFEGAHTVELLVADRPFDEFGLDPPARVVEGDGLTDLHSWTVELIRTVDPGCVSGGT